jgi:hypothetical protein
MSISSLVANERGDNTHAAVMELANPDRLGFVFQTGRAIAITALARGISFFKNQSSDDFQLMRLYAALCSSFTEIKDCKTGG